MAQHQLGKFSSKAKKGTIIIPKSIPGYITPEGQVLREANQRFNFVYKPIQYNIFYNLNDGIAPLDRYKTQYTIEDEDYIPPSPTKEDHKFVGWDPEKISKGTIGDITFEAIWKPNAILLKGSILNEKFTQLAGSKESIMAIKSINSMTRPAINISSTSTPVLAAFDQGIIYIYSEDEIYCNLDMSSMCEGFTILRDISALSSWICKDGTDISNIFKDCSLLSDVLPMSTWAHSGNFSNFNNAFKGTMALMSSRVPSWYKWNVQIKYLSSSGKVLREVNEDHIPGEIMYSPTFNGYTYITKNLEITSPDKVYEFLYEPIVYDISYELNGGNLTNPKTQYTIEDESYYPPEPFKPGFKFNSWYPKCINTGDYGNTSFIASYNL